MPAREPEVVHVTTVGRRSGQPREVELWFTREAQRVYLVAETGRRAGWVRNILANSRVRWRLAGRTRSGRARIVEVSVEPELCRQVEARSVAKYGWGDGLVVELTPDGADGRGPSSRRSSSTRRDRRDARTARRSTAQPRGRNA